MKSLDHIISIFSGRVWKPDVLLLVQKLVYLWLILHLIWLLPIAPDLWGDQSLIFPLSNRPTLLNNVFFKLNYVRDLYIPILCIHGIAAVLSFVGIMAWIPRVIVYISGGMMYFSAYLAFNSGFLLIWLFSFFLIFYRPKAKNEWSRAQNNFVYLAMLVQFLLVYSIAALWKWTGTDWPSGMATYYTVQMDHFTIPWVKDFLLENLLLLKILNWSAFLYQTLFIFMVWWRRFKYVWLGIGILFHLYIIVVMGLWDFGTAMIFGYSLFIDQRLSRRLLSLFKIQTEELVLE